MRLKQRRSQNEPFHYLNSLVALLLRDVGAFLKVFESLEAQKTLIKHQRVLEKRKLVRRAGLPKPGMGQAC